MLLNLSNLVFKRACKYNGFYIDAKELYTFFECNRKIYSQLCIFSYCWPIIARTILKSTYQIIAKDIPAQPHVKTKITPIAANAKR